MPLFLNSPLNKRAPLFQNFQNKRPPRIINALLPRGCLFETFCYFPGKHVYTSFELLDEDIVKAAPSFNLIENDDVELQSQLEYVAVYSKSNVFFFKILIYTTIINTIITTIYTTIITTININYNTK